MKNLLKFLFAFLPLGLMAQIPPATELQTPFEQQDEKVTATYEETMAYYRELEKASPKVKIEAYQPGTDIGQPLHAVIISGDENFQPVLMRRADKRIVMILNAIHPGEPCGVDACMMLARDLVTGPMYRNLLEHVTLVIVPIYNVGGALNRSCCSRANQNGPESYGFRGNARNLDLNRDFIKNDSRNARSFKAIFHKWEPDIFIDTHTSNGADYPYFMTYIPTQCDKFCTPLAQYMNESLNPSLVGAMEKVSYPMCPYVQTLGWQMPPDSGLVGFLETARYSTGYTTLFNTIGYTTEAHMLKSYSDRVWGTYHFLENLLKFTNRDRKLIGRLRKQAREEVIKQEEFTLRWKADRKHPDKLNFRGYEARYKTSTVTGLPRLYYDRESPWQREIPYYNTYVSEVSVKKPEAYLIPQGWTEVIDRMKASGVQMKQLREDAELEGEVYYIESYESSKTPYEGHYLHYNTQVRKETQTQLFRKGDYVIYTDQACNRFIVETLEPEGVDSWFSWNFFDAILQRKEYFSPYVFEETAQKLLEVHPEWKQELEAARQQDSLLAKNDWMQMDFIYRKSEWYEKSHNRYPVVRLVKAGRLPLEK